VNLGDRTVLGFWIAVGAGIGIGLLLHPSLGRGAFVVGPLVGWAVDVAMRWGRG
jgi:hypothetical protein